MVSVKAPETRSEPSVRPGLVWVFGTWSFLASLLIFWVELMVARLLLPQFGGSPSVWNTSLVFFQVTLLIGYAGAHFLARLDSRAHKLVQSLLVALPLITLPVALPTFLDSQTMGPTLAVLISLTVMVGAPFFALSTSTPTLQAWFSHSDHPRSLDPYFLYALSNVGSVVALFGYPLVLERTLTLRSQSIAWSVGYVVFVALTVAGARMVGGWRPAQPVKREVPTVRRRLRWAGIAFIPSLALLGVTRQVSTDVAAFPLLWTVPLAIYLASFVVTFRNGSERWTDAAQRVLRPLVVIAVVLTLPVLPEALWLTVGAMMLLLGAVSVSGHGLVYADRPEAGSLTHFYLWVSIGGAAGGLFASILAPVLFDSIMEYSLALVLAAWLAGAPVRRRGLNQRFLGALLLVALVVGMTFADAGGRVVLVGAAGVIGVLWLDRKLLVALVAGMLIVASTAVSSDLLAKERTFFGVHRVSESEGIRILANGTTLHGSQLTVGDRSTPTSYYAQGGPAGDVFSAMPQNQLDVGVVGLGVGSLASYGATGDRFTFYEIDPIVEEFARDERYFTLLSGSEATVDVVIGDGRLELERRMPSHDLLVVDAFSSDAIPVHLLTLEAFELYLDSLSPDGLLLVHISNRHVQLEPVVARIAEELAVTARIGRYDPGPDDEAATKSVWMLIEKGQPIDLPERWEHAVAGDSLWTDNYSNILSVIDWN